MKEEELMNTPVPVKVCQHHVDIVVYVVCCLDAVLSGNIPETLNRTRI